MKPTAKIVGQKCGPLKRLTFLSVYLFVYYTYCLSLQVSFANRRKGKENPKGDCKTSQTSSKEQSYPAR